MKVALQPEARIEAEVKRKGRLLKEGYVRLISSTQDSFSAGLAESEGRVIFDRLPEGDYALEVLDQNNQQLYYSMLTLERGKSITRVIEVTGQ